MIVKPLSRQEINLRRLLAKCELMCKARKEDDRIEKYIGTLDNMMKEVKTLIESNEKLSNYKKRINDIKTAVGIALDKSTDEDPEVSRNSLLGLGLRHRNKEKKSSTTNDLDEIINYHENRQKKLTDDMLSLAQSLKEQSQTANKIIKRDTEVVSQSSGLAQQNLAKLSDESSKLTEYSNRAWKCWMWIMLAIVLIVFINMVVFMKVVKKKY